MTDIDGYPKSAVLRKGRECSVFPYSGFRANTLWLFVLSASSFKSPIKFTSSKQVASNIVLHMQVPQAVLNRAVPKLTF
jgi:hypothetical protein